MALFSYPPICLASSYNAQFMVIISLNIQLATFSFVLVTLRNLFPIYCVSFKNQFFVFVAFEATDKMITAWDHLCFNY